MSMLNDRSAARGHAVDMTSAVRNRTGLLLLLSCICVALAFGVSFYFALVSNQTAVARQFPELASTVERFKGMLVMNTFSFVAIIIASLWILSRIVTARFFAPLGAVMAGMRRVCENRLPGESVASGSGPLEPFENQWSILVSTLRANEEREIAALRECAATLGGPGGAEPGLKALRGVIERKQTRLGIAPAEEPAAPEAARTNADKVFMQPL